MRKDRGASLVVVIMAIIIIAILGWSLVNMQSSDFEIGWRSLESEKALGLAEAGIYEAMRLMKSDDTAFDADTDTLTRRLDDGEYFVNRTSLGREVTIVSTGYLPNITDYRTKRKVAVVYIDYGLGDAINGANLFDWFNMTLAGSDGIQGPIYSKNWYGKLGIGDKSMPDITYPRQNSNYPISPINMTWFEEHPDATIVNGDLTIDSNYNSKKIVYVKGDVIIDTGNKANKGVNVQHTNIISEGNIEVIGIGTLSMIAHVVQTGRTWPCVATKNGNIKFSAPGSGDIKDRDFDGLIYSEKGTIDIDYLGGKGAVMGNEIRLRGKIDFTTQDKYIDFTNGFLPIGNNGIVAWKEE